MIDYREKSNGTVTLILDKEGHRKVLEYNIDDIKIEKPQAWDRLWRLVIFDIPEFKKKARDVLTKKLKLLGLLALQKSVFVYPYDCKDEIEFISEIFEIKPYVRFILAKEIDIALDLKDKFNLL